MKHQQTTGAKSGAFSDDELKALRDRYERDGPTAIAGDLGRTVKSVKGAASRMGLRFYRRTGATNAPADRLAAPDWSAMAAFSPTPPADLSATPSDVPRFRTVLAPGVAWIS